MVYVVGLRTRDESLNLDISAQDVLKSRSGGNSIGKQGAMLWERAEKTKKLRDTFVVTFVPAECSCLNDTILLVFLSFLVSDGGWA